MQFEKWASKTFKPGQTFNRLTILSTHKIPGTYKYYAYCQCSCGSKPLYIRIDGLVKQAVQSCGCLHKERVTIHGQCHHPLWPVWNAMKERCYNPKDDRYYA